jgi:hypothetical protein
MMRQATWPWLVIAVLPTAALAAEQEFEPPAPPDNIQELGARIQRTMTLLATSSPEKRNRVRILLYGQSVTRNPWSSAVAENLRQAYPHADLEIENRAIGGYTAPTLIHTAEYDLYPFYPDLLVFHVYGGVESGEQEEIIRRTRQRTTAEILLWTSHFRWPRDLPRDGSPDDPAAQKLYQADEKRTQMIRELAETYGCELAEVREPMRQYLAEHDLFPKDTLRDSVHPNELGNFLIEKLIMPYFRYDAGFPTRLQAVARTHASAEPWQDLVRDLPADDEAVERRPDGSLKLRFEGNRIDVIAAHTDDERLGSARVLIDGKRPSEFPELYYHARPAAAPYTTWPAINRIDHEAPLVVEKWTAKILECDPEQKILKYEVIGSATGPDGQGDHRERFVSNSGRVVIEAGRWMVCHALSYREKPLPEDYEVTWEVKPLFVDTYQAPKTDDPATEYATTLAQGLNNAEHTVELVPNGDGPVPVQALRVYRPPLR